MSKRLFISAPFSEKARAEALACVLRSLGHEVVSHWHEPQFSDIEPTDLQELGDIWAANIRDLREATHLVCLFDEGTPRAAYAELGYFLALCSEVSGLGCAYVIQSPAHPAVMGANRVTLCRSVADLLSKVES